MGLIPTPEETRAQNLAASVAPYNGGAAPTSSPALFSSEQGLSLLQNQQKKEAQLSPPPATTSPATTSNAATPTPSAQQSTQKPAQTSTAVTLINPQTDQKMTFNDASLNKENIQSYLGTGWTVSEASGQIPSWMKPANDGTFSVANSNPDFDAAKTALSKAQSNLSSFNVENDPTLQRMLQGISAQWDQRIQDMEQSNKSREAGLNTQGIRSGSRYASEVNASIISGEETQAAQRISQLQSSKDQSLLAAKTAFQDKEWTKYSKAVDQAQHMYDQQLQSVQDLNKAQAAQNAKLQEQQQSAQQSTAIATIMKNGVTDPKDILTKLNGMGFTIDSKTLKDALDVFNVQNPDQKDMGALYKNLAESGAPTDAISAVQNAPNLAEAYKAASPYLKNYQGGIIGEYQYYADEAKKAGKTPVDFQTYQNIDANRKAKAAGTTPDPNRVLSVSEAQALALPFGTTASQAYGKIPAKPPTASQEQAAGYADRTVQSASIIATLESKIAGMNSAQYAAAVAAENTTLGNSWVSDDIKQLRQAERNFATAQLRRESGAAISPTEFDTFNKQYFPQPGDDPTTLANKAQARASVTKALVTSAGGAYTGTNQTADLINQGHDQAQKQVVDYGSQHPETRAQIKTLLTQPQPELGRPLTYDEVLQVLNHK